MNILLIYLYLKNVIYGSSLNGHLVIVNPYTRKIGGYIDEMMLLPKNKICFTVNNARTNIPIIHIFDPKKGVIKIWKGNYISLVGIFSSPDSRIVVVFKYLIPVSPVSEELRERNIKKIDIGIINQSTYQN